jgi:hypothetical protein
VPSFFTGNFINRFGALRGDVPGAGILLAGVTVALLGMGPWNFRIALTLNGLGRNFLFVGAPTLVTTNYRPSSWPKATPDNKRVNQCTILTAVLILQEVAFDPRHCEERSRRGNPVQNMCDGRLPRRKRSSQ